MYERGRGVNPSIVGRRQVRRDLRERGRSTCRSPSEGWHVLHGQGDQLRPPWSAPPTMPAVLGVVCRHDASCAPVGLAAVKPVDYGKSRTWGALCGEELAPLASRGRAHAGPRDAHALCVDASARVLPCVLTPRPYLHQRVRRGLVWSRSGHRGRSRRLSWIARPLDWPEQR